jgi:hypothetical protein
MPMPRSLSIWLALATLAGCASTPATLPEASSAMQSSASPPAQPEPDQRVEPGAMPELPAFASVESVMGRTGALPSVVADTADALLSGLEGLCGQAFAGEIEADVPTPAASPFAGKPLVMHVRGCG